MFCWFGQYIPFYGLRFNRNIMKRMFIMYICIFPKAWKLNVCSQLAKKKTHILYRPYTHEIEILFYCIQEMWKVAGDIFFTVFVLFLGYKWKEEKNSTIMAMEVNAFTRTWFTRIAWVLNMWEKFKEIFFVVVVQLCIFCSVIYFSFSDFCDRHWWI